MADETNAMFDGSEEARRQEQDSQSAQQAQQTAHDAENLKAEEFSQQPPESGNEEQPFGNKKDDTRSLSERDGQVGALQEEPSEPLPDNAPLPDSELAMAPPVQQQEEGREPAEQPAPPHSVGRSTGSVSSSTLRTERPGAGQGEEQDPGNQSQSSGGPLLQPQAQQQPVPEEEEAAKTAQNPSLEIEDAQGSEDSPIPLDITALLQDADGGGEVLSVVIAGVPEGAVLSAGIDNGDGTWTLTPAELQGLTITPPHNSNVDFTLEVTATSVEANGDTASITLPLNVDVIGVADQPLLTATLDSGPEDTPVDFEISGSLTDTDGSETLHFVVSNMPDGAVLSAGTDNGDGTWTLTPEQLDGLQFTPPPNYTGDISLEVTAVATENDGDVASVSQPVSTNITMVADAPDVSVGDVSGFEDSPIPLDLTAALTDPSETLSVVIGNVPDGAVLNHGTNLGGGNWSVDPADLGDLTITPPDDSSDDMQLTITATSTEGDGTKATTTSTFNVEVVGVADTPDLVTPPTSGDEDTAVPLVIDTGLNDLDGSESLEITIANVPDGFTLSAGIDNGDGTWTLQPGDLGGLTISAPQDYSGTFDLEVTATSTENDGDSTSISSTLPVVFTGVADVPDVAAENVTTNEDTLLPLDLGAVATDVDGSENITNVVLTGVPAGFTVIGGTFENGAWTIPPDQLDSVSIQAPEHYSGTLNLGLTVTATDTGGDTATNSASFTATFTPVADAPIVAAEAASGLEDTPIPLDLSAALVDQDGSETLSVVIRGVPSDASLNLGVLQPNGDYLVEAGDLGNLELTTREHFSGDIPLTIIATSTEGANGDTATTEVPFNVHVVGDADIPGLSASLGTATEDTNMDLNIAGTLVDADSSETLSYVVSGVPDGFTLTDGTHVGGGVWELTPDQLAGLQVVPPADFSGDIQLQVSVTTTEHDGDFETVTTTVNGHFTGDADAPLASAGDVTGTEDMFIDLNLSAELTDQSEDLTTYITGVPDGAVLNHGTNLGGGRWSVEPGDLADLAIRPPQHTSNADAGPINLTLEVTSTEQDGDISTVERPFTVNVTPDADAPNLAAEDVTGQEDIPTPLNISSSLVDQDGSEVLSIVVSGVLPGFSLSAGIDNGDGTWTLTADDLDGLTISTPHNYKGIFDLDVAATTVEPNGDTETVSEPFTVTIDAVADEPVVTVQPASTKEEQSVPLEITVDTADSTETIDSIVISGVPDGTTLSAGIDNGDGSWTLTPAQLTGLTLNPTHDSNVDFTLTVTTTSSEPNGSMNTNVSQLPVHIKGLADTPDLDTQDAKGGEDWRIHLNIDGALNDVDGSETLHYEISNLPPGATLWGRNPGGGWTKYASTNGVFTIDPDDIDNVYVRSAWNDDSDFTLNVAAVATENDMVDAEGVAIRTGTIDVTVNAQADWVRIRTGGSWQKEIEGTEDIDLPLELSANLYDTDGSESISKVVITIKSDGGIDPEDFAIVGGTDLGNGKWEVVPSQLGNVSLRPLADYSGEVKINVAVTTHEAENGHERTTAVNFTASFEAVADTPVAQVDDATIDALEDTPINLNLTAELTDVDGSESLTIVISGVENGVLSAGTDNGDGTWTVTYAELATLQFIPAEHYSGDVPMTMTVTSTEASNDDAATNSVDFNVHVTGVADTPTLAVVDAFGDEDTDINLTIRATTPDMDGSESLYVVISGMPDGAVLNVDGTPLPASAQMADGSWKVPAGDLDSLSITPPLDSNVDFTLTVRSLTEESDGDSAYSDPQYIDVSLQGVPDAPTYGGTSTPSGNEDAAIPLQFHAISTDADPSETISYVITGVPADASLSAGVYIGNGRWSVSETDMSTLTITPADDFSGDINLGVRVVVQENDGRESFTDHTVTVTVDPVVDTPGGLPTATGDEDTIIDLDVTPGLRDSDGSEEIQWVEVSGVPTGATLLIDGLPAVETSPGSGIYHIDPADFGNVAIQPPHNSDDSFNLNVKVAIQDSDGPIEVFDRPLTVDPAAVADTPTITSGPISGDSHTDIPADITAVLNDLDGSEQLDYIVSVPEGSQVVPTVGINLGGGNFLIPAGELANLGFRYEGGSTNTTIPITVHAIATEEENGDTASASTTFDLNVTGNGSTGGVGTPVPIVPPSITVVPGATGVEDGIVTVTVEAQYDANADQYGIIISGLEPEGAKPQGGYYNPIDNTWIIPGANGVSEIQIVPPEDYAGELTFDVSASQTNHDGTTSTDDAPATAEITPVVDTPSVYLGDSSGTEDTNLAVDLHVVPTDVDGSEEVTSVIIKGVPAGATILGAVDNHDGTWTVDLDHLDQVQFVPPTHAHGHFTFTVETTVEDSTGTAGAQKTFTNTVGVNIEADTDQATLTTNDASGHEDQAVTLDLGAELIDQDGSEVIAVTISNVPTDALFSAGSNNGDGSWTFTPAQLNGLTFTAPPGASGSFDMTLNAHTMETSTGESVTTSQSFTVDVAGVADQGPTDAQGSEGLEDTLIPVLISAELMDTDGSESISVELTGFPEGTQFSHGHLDDRGTADTSDDVWIVNGTDLPNLMVDPPEHFSGNINLHAEIITTEQDGDSTSVGHDLIVTVNPVADAPNLNPQVANGTEDTEITLDLQASLVDPSEALALTISGVPEGATLSAGTQHEDGSWVLTQLEYETALANGGLKFIPAENQSGDFTLDITARSTDSGSLNADTHGTLSLHIEGVADAPGLTVIDASGTEDDAEIALDIQSTLTDSTEVLSVTISGIPVGASLSAGTDNGDGSWTLTPDQLSGLKLLPAADQSGDFTLTVDATSSEPGTTSTATISKELAVSIEGVADEPNLTVTNASGDEDMPIALDIQSSLSDSSEVLSIVIDGVPNGALLSAGTDNHDGTWTLEPEDLPGLTITPPQDDASDFTLGVTATSTDGSSQAEATAVIDVVVTGIPDEPDFETHTASGTQDHPIDLAIDAATTAPDETLSITISDLPDGSSLSAGIDNGDGSWTLETGDLTGLQITPPSGFSGTFDLDVSVTVMQDGNELVRNDSLDVTVTAPPAPLSMGAMAYSTMMAPQQGMGNSPMAMSTPAQDYLEGMGLGGENPGGGEAMLAMSLDQSLNGALGVSDSLDNMLDGSEHQDGGAGHEGLADVLPEPMDGPNDDDHGANQLDMVDQYQDM